MENICRNDVFHLSKLIIYKEYSEFLSDHSIDGYKKIRKIERFLKTFYTCLN